MNLTVEQNKLLVENYPFLQPRSVWTDEIPDDYAFEYINGVGDVPRGWERLFLLFAKHLKIELDKYHYTDKFRFTQIKEKYGSLRLYNSGYPKDSNVSELEYIFEHLSTYVCEDCGRIAKYETPGWITELCDSCFKTSYQSLYLEQRSKYKLRRKNYTVKVSGWTKELGHYTKRYDCRPYWDEYLRCRKMTDDEFINYLLVS